MTSKPVSSHVSSHVSHVLVHKQFNSPIRLYSPENVAEVLKKQSQVLANGAVGIDFHQLSTPPNLANSAVLRMLEEEERQRGGIGKEMSESPPTGRQRRRFQWPPSQGTDVDVKHTRHHFSTFPLSTTPGLKRIAWPPPPDYQDFIEEQPVYSKGLVLGEPPIEAQPWRPAIRPTQPVTASAPAPAPAPAYEPPPSTVVLRNEPPISQQPPPIVTSQPAATRGSGPRMRGDEKWPPAEHKARVQAENEARVALARGPAVRPRKVKRDYTNFFAQNALTPNYPSYRAPPGTQHYVEEGTSNF